LINLAALGYLIFFYKTLGNSYQCSLRIAWDLIILGAIENGGYRAVHLKIKGLNLIHHINPIPLILSKKRNVDGIYRLKYLKIVIGANKVVKKFDQIPSKKE